MSWTPLSHAVYIGHNDIVQLLLETDAVDIHHQDINEKTPFHLAVWGHHLSILKLLGPRMLVDIKTRYTDDKSFLFFAIDGYLVEGLRYLLQDLKLDPNCRDRPGRTPLMHAAQQRNTEIVKVLVEDLRTLLLVEDEDSYTALDLCCDPKIRHILEDAIKYRWNQDWDVVVEQISMWPEFKRLWPWTGGKVLHS